MKAQRILDSVAKNPRRSQDKTLTCSIGSP